MTALLIKKMFASAVTAIAVSVLLFGSMKSEGPDSAHVPQFKGVCWVAGDSIALHNIEHAQAVGVNWISQTPFGWMSAHDDPVVVLNNKRAWWGEADRGLIHTAQLARIKGIKTMLKPHIWIRGRGDKWRSDIAMKNQIEWDQWFASYEKFILHYAQLAEVHNIEILCIGTELSETTRLHTDKWRALIRKIRAVYSGELTYAANWYKEYDVIDFWDELDFIGIQAYFPLSKKENPEKKDLIKAWGKHKRNISRVARKFDMQVIFTEVGYKNTADSAIKPWTWPQHLGHDEIVLSQETQRKCYEALFESLWQEPWMGGCFIWKWFHSTYRHDDIGKFMEERKKRYMRRNSGSSSPRHQVVFTPQVSNSLDVMAQYYGKR